MKCLESCVSFRFSFMVIFIDDFDIMVKAEDRACQQERLGHIIEQSRRHVVNLDHLIRHEGDATHNEQHGTGVLGDFKPLFSII